MSIPAEKVRKLQETNDRLLKKPVVGARALRSYAGGLSFVAGLLPHLRPFLGSIWAALGGAGGASDGAARHAGKLIHTRRFGPALGWIGALLEGRPAPLVRTLYSKEVRANAQIVTDACPFGIGGILRVDDKPEEFFAADIPQEALEKFRARWGDSKWTTLWEGLALLLAFRMWLPRLGFHTRCLVKSDSLSTLIMLAKGKAKSPELNVLAREFALDQALREYRVWWLEHIPGVTNQQADALSRLEAPERATIPEALHRVPRRTVDVGPGFWKVQLRAPRVEKKGGPSAGVDLACSGFFRDRMGRLKRSLPCRPPPPIAAPRRAGGPLPLVEGPAIRPPGAPTAPPEDLDVAPLPGTPRPYRRGTASAAHEAATDPDRCRRALLHDASAATSRRPLDARKQLWATLGRQAGIIEPFDLTPDVIYVIMGAMKIAGYRSAELYLDSAKGEHVARGGAWTDQLVQARRAAIRSCRRHLGHPRQAKGLPLTELGAFTGEAPLAPGGPMYPGAATILASWWLLREIEASAALCAHVQVDTHAQRVSWTLPCTKTDQQALGAVRTHSCSCEFSDPAICPYHVMVRHLATRPAGPATPLFQALDGAPPTKAGWADTFQALAQRLGLPVAHANGARAYTGHSARATGAMHLASTNVELWRIQLFGRWGSNVFLSYIREAPMAQLDRLALESSAQLSVQTARTQLQDLLRRTATGERAALASDPEAAKLPA